MEGLSVAIITLNEERNIARCIESLGNLADEIVVLDAFSTDRTVEIAESLGARVIQRKWEGYSASKNFLNEQCRYAYILSLDADEALSSALLQELRAEKTKGFNGIYSVNRMTNYLGTWIKHSGWFPDIKTRLFPKKDSYWSGAYVHEELITAHDKPHLFTGVLEHYSYYSYEDHRARADKYSLLTAQKMAAQGKRAGLLKPYVSAIARFVSMYFIKLGILDGWKGFKIAQISALSNILKYKELRKLSRKSA